MNECPDVHVFDRAEIYSLYSINKRDCSVEESHTLYFGDRENDNFILWLCDRKMIIFVAVF